MTKLSVRHDSFPLKQPFSISRGTVNHVDVVTVEIEDGVHTGRGECRPYARYNESIDSVRDQINSIKNEIELGLDVKGLQPLLPAGAARNAVDCALWDLQAKRTAKSVWQLAGLHAPSAREVTYTISLNTPQAMARDAAQSERPLLKLKLGAEDDMARLRAVRQAAVNSRLIIDANEGWTSEFLFEHSPEMAHLGVELVEQPLPADEDEVLTNYNGPVPLCADESCHTAKDVPRLATKYEYLNIKLDKTGGLTGAIELANRAQEAPMKLMLGCMMASSLAMAPAFLLASRAEYVDLDAPLLLATDRAHPFQYRGAVMQPNSPALWG